MEILIMVCTLPLVVVFIAELFSQLEGMKRDTQRDIAMLNHLNSLKGE